MWSVWAVAGRDPVSDAMDQAVADLDTANFKMMSLPSNIGTC